MNREDGHTVVSALPDTDRIKVIRDETACLGREAEVRRQLAERDTNLEEVQVFMLLSPNFRPVACLVFTSKLSLRHE